MQYTSKFSGEEIDSILDNVAGKQDAIPDLETIRSNAKNASDTIARMVESGYLFAGIATIDTNPGTPDAKVFYIANGKGTYTNFGSLEVTEDEVVIFYWDSAWHKVATGIASQAKLSELERNTAEIKSTEENSQLCIADDTGNVLVEFNNGHIKTEKFDSSETGVNTNESSYNSELFLSDIHGNVIAEFSEGHIKTEKFNSSDIGANNTDFYCEFDYPSMNTAIIDNEFNIGDIILLHISINSQRRTDGSVESKTQYLYKDKDGVYHSLCNDYGYNFAKIVLKEKIYGLKAIVPEGLIWGYSGLVRFYAYKYEENRLPHYISVAADGSGDYTTIRAAIDSITDNNAYNKYVIEVHEGIYNVFDDYTIDEITNTDFKGAFVNDGVSIVGVGNKDKIILYGELPLTIDASKRNDISTLNMGGTCAIKNLTIHSKNMRYCIHDDFGAMKYQINEKRLEDLVLIGENLAYRVSINGVDHNSMTFGAGGGNYKTLICKNVDFGENLVVHNSADNVAGMNVIFENCICKNFSFNDYDCKAMTNITMINCKGTIVNVTKTGEHEPYMFVDMKGCDAIMINAQDGYIVSVNATKVVGSLAKGTAVSIDSDNLVASATTNKNNIFGISIGTLDKYMLIQKNGYVCSLSLGLPSVMTIGDYITLDSSGVVVSGGTANDNIGKVIFVGKNYSVIKLNF